MWRNGTGAVIGMLLWSVVAGQNSQPRSPLYPEKLHADIDLIRATLLAAHPMPHRYLDSAALAARFDELKASIRVPMDPESFQAILVPVFQSIGDRGCAPHLPLAVERDLREHRRVLPLRVRIIGDGMYVEEELKGFRSLEPGSRLIAIDGVPVDSLIARMAALYVTDGHNRTLALRMIEKDLPWDLQRVLGSRSSHLVRYQKADGTVAEQVLFPMTGTEIARTRKPSGASLQPWRASWEAEASTMWLTLRTMDHDSLTLAGQHADRFLRSLKKDMAENKAKALVIDVRGAGGGDVDLAEQVFALIAQQPYRALGGVVMRTRELDPELRPYIGGLTAMDAASVGLTGLENGTFGLNDRDERARWKAPDPQAFTGKVYIVADGFTRDAAASLVALVKRSARGKFVGEETGSNTFCWSGSEPVVLTAPNSGVRVTIPVVMNVMEGSPSGPLDRGEQPQHGIEQRPAAIAQGRDTVRESLLELLREILH